MNRTGKLKKNAQQLNSTQPDTSFSKNILLFLLLLLLLSVVVFIHSRSKKFIFRLRCFRFLADSRIQSKLAECDETDKKLYICNVQIHQFRVQIELNLNHCANYTRTTTIQRYCTRCAVVSGQIAVNDISIYF